MAMMIKILSDDQRPLCIYDGHKWLGNTDPVIMSEAVELLVMGMHHYREKRIIRDVTKNWDKPPEDPKD